MIRWEVDDKDEHERTTAKAVGMKRIACHLQSLGGHIHGDYVVHAILRNEPEIVEKIECTMPIATICYTASGLTSCGFVVSDEESPEANEANNHKLLKIRWPSNQYLCHVDLAPFYRSRIVADPHPIFFDLNMLSISRERLSVRRPIPKHLKYCGELLSIFISRTNRAQFCLANRSALSADPEDEGEKKAIAKFDAEAMKKSVLLIGKGWYMDDWLQGSKGWIVAQWKDIGHSRAYAGSSGSSISVRQHSNCPLCYEKFSDDDFVVNLPCNHNFHVHCHANPGRSNASNDLNASNLSNAECHPSHPSDSNRTDATSEASTCVSSGLYAWLSHGNLTCPCCRANVRYFSE